MLELILKQNRTLYKAREDPLLYKVKAKNPARDETDMRSNLETVTRREEESSSLRSKGLDFVATFRKKRYENMFLTKNKDKGRFLLVALKLSGG